MGWLIRRLACLALLLGLLSFGGTAPTLAATPTCTAAVLNGVSGWNCPLVSLSTSATTTATFGATGSWSLAFNANGSTASTDGCYNSLNGIGASSCSGDDIFATIQRGTVELTVYNTTANTPLISAAANATSTFNLNFVVKTPSAGEKFQSASAAMTSCDVTTSEPSSGKCNSRSTALAAVTGTESGYNSSAKDTTYFGPLSPTVNAGYTGSGAFTTANQNQSMFIDKSFTVANPSGSGVTLALNTVSQLYYTNPEPISLSLFGVGIVGLGLARVRRRRA